MPAHRAGRQRQSLKPTGRWCQPVAPLLSGEREAVPGGRGGIAGIRARELFPRSITGLAQAHWPCAEKGRNGKSANRPWPKTAFVRPHRLGWRAMKTTVPLDDPTLLANRAQPVHRAFPFTASGPSSHRGPDDRKRVAGHSVVSKATAV